jgi:hypothetical protein
MRITILKECGFDEALMGLGLSYDITSDSISMDDKTKTKMKVVASKLAGKGGGENKFLEFMQIWLDITAPRYWWAQFDTYRIGVSKQSQSTMHTIMRRKITQSMFSEKIPVSYVKQIEKLRTENDFIKLKSLLPECFLQRRIVNLNYMSLRNIINQRENHKLLEWKAFCQYMKDNCEHYDMLRKE